MPGAHKCECPEGYDGNPDDECIDVDECLRSPCGRSALCTNLRGSFRCSCPEGMDGDPLTGCHGELIFSSSRVVGKLLAFLCEY